MPDTRRAAAIGSCKRSTCSRILQRDQPGRAWHGGVRTGTGGAAPSNEDESLGRLVAVMVPSLLIALLGAEVQIVSDVGEIAGTFRRRSSRRLRLVDTLNVVTGALSVAIVTLVQGVGVSQSVPNRDGITNTDLPGLHRARCRERGVRPLSGLPVGGSLSGTAISVISGAATRWASDLRRALDGRDRDRRTQAGRVHRDACARCTPDGGGRQQPEAVGDCGAAQRRVAVG